MAGSRGLFLHGSGLEGERPRLQLPKLSIMEKVNLNLPIPFSHKRLWEKVHLIRPISLLRGDFTENKSTYSN